MTVKIELPAEIEAALREQWSDLPRAVLEAVAIEGYRKGLLSLGQVAALLGLESRWDARQFLADRRAGQALTEEELDSDTRALDRLLPQSQ
jgi:predicted HTH domain antitoxin